jgi:uroporphyrinogen-III synthase
MALSKISEVLAALRRQKWPKETPVLIVSKGTRHDEKILKGTLETIEGLIKKEKPEPPALMIVGKTVDFYRPLKEMKTILFVGTRPDKYRSLGRLIHMPMIRIQPVTFSKVAKKYFLNELTASDLILVTSEYTVESLCKLFKPSELKSKTFAAIGSHTAQALLDYDVHPHMIASEETSEGLFKDLQNKFDLKNKFIVFPRSALPNPFLKKALTKAGARVKEVTVYKNLKPAKRRLPKESIDAIIFTSPSTAVNFLKDYGKIPPSWEILCKGPVSQKALLKFGYKAKIIN